VKGTSGNRYLVYRSRERRDALFLENREGVLYLLDVTGSVRARPLAVGRLLEQGHRCACIPHRCYAGQVCMSYCCR
jgi:hypothetical protein